jgi:hypothetical protein
MTALYGYSQPVKASSHPASSATGFSFAMVNQATGNCADVKTWSTTPGAIIQQYHCASTTNQLWYPVVVKHDSSGNSTVIFKSVNSGLCLDLAFASKSAGIGLIQNTCTGGATQQWIVSAPYVPAVLFTNPPVSTTVPAVFRRIENAYSGLCMRAADGGDQAAITQQSCDVNDAHFDWRVSFY